MAAADHENQTKAESIKSPDSKEDSKDQKAQALMALVTGKRNMLVQDIPAAVSSLGEACELLSAEFGENAPECAEAYLYYGKALLEMARLESGVLGNSLGGDGESKEQEEQGEESEEDDEGEGGEPEKKEEEESNDHEAEDEEEPSNLQLAWEMLELAKMVFTDQLEGVNKDFLTTEVKSDIEKKLCETFLTLGEVSLENESYVQAVEDLTLCLERQKASLATDSRNIAETHYQLGVALGFHMKFDEAIASFEAAIAVLHKRISNLKSKTESPEKTMKEIGDIEALIPDIQDKITDTNEMKEETTRKIAEIRKQIGFGSSSSFGAGSSTSTAQPVSSITIKRKHENGSPEDTK